MTTETPTGAAPPADPTARPLFDPFAPGFTDDPYPQYAALREAAPVYAHPMGFWLLTRYRDVSALLRAGLSVEDRHVSPDSAFAQVRARVYDVDVAGGERRRVPVRSMLDRDPPDHTRLRKLVSKAFTPRAVRDLRPRVTELVDDLVAELWQAREADFVQTLAFPLPFTVIAELLGTPPTDHARIRELTGTLVRGLEPVADPELAAAIGAADVELRAIAGEIIAWKRTHPADDLLTGLIAAEDGGDVLSDEELVAQTLLLYIAGHETTVNLLAGGAHALLAHPDQLALLRADPDRVPGAVEELLRYDSPVQASRRVTLEPVTVRDADIPAGAFVMASLGAANRDEHFFGPDAGTLDVTRVNAHQHVSFGAGPHHCLGASLARLEAAVTFERLATRLPDLALAGPVVWNGRINLRGPACLPVSAR